MSDSTDIFKSEPTTSKVDGGEFPALRIEFGTPEAKRSLVIRDSLGPGQYLDAVETYGATKSENAEGLMLVAFRVDTIDDKPRPPYRDRKEVQRYLDKIGNDGIAAIARAYGVSKTSTEADLPDVVGN